MGSPPGGSEACCKKGLGVWGFGFRFRVNLESITQGRAKRGGPYPGSPQMRS